MVAFPHPLARAAGEGEQPWFTDACERTTVLKPLARATGEGITIASYPRAQLNPGGAAMVRQHHRVKAPRPRHGRGVGVRGS